MSLNNVFLCSVIFVASISSIWVTASEPSLISVATDIVIEGLSKKKSVKNSSEMADLIADELESPYTQNKILNSYLESSSGLQVLKDINFQFKAFDADENSSAALGFSYDYSKVIASRELGCKSSACVQGLDLSFLTIGNVAFDQEKNPNDFLKSAFEFSFYKSIGGSPDKSVSNLALQLDQQFVDAKTVEDEEKVVQELIGQVRPHLSDQFYYELTGNASLESNQSFSLKQYTYGVYTIVEVKSWNNYSKWSKFNVFDYPFALLRMLSGLANCESASGCFTPSGTAWPTLLVGLSRVMPEDDDPRALAGDSSDFDRGELELSFKTILAESAGKNIYISANYRYFKEFDAVAEVTAEDLDSFDFTTLIIGGDDGPFISYTDGKLPLDRKDDQVFELGFKFHL